MGGAGLYLWLTLACALSVLGLFGIGWVLVAIGRRQERARAARRSTRAEGGEP